MKNFLEVFGISFILLTVFMMFGGSLVFENIWAIIAFVAFIISVIGSIFMYQETKIEDLEDRIKKIESQNGNKK
ncbi:MAG: hypothetical protein K0S22_998 [Oscillospiraceae bacterium]|jgi:glucan phosphoethanolaminetransferase (alkaline phosphatase superfamily)|nr:hypothetical protein [Oscillospiraceae bacterium]